ncbi:DUF6524 family protein [Candidatus Vondammii sp. HM_W22]|uniref:DUF6524 family protein n=1 Tax=Candidatus Vondammii sp. HM_W22 TaxID=2687299 RepID=UPI001F143D4B|nr:DUF6524 family protein [Candidatus Vondammii sp. HM_W22]
MASRYFSGGSFLFRLLLAVVVIFTTYNPESYSYYHWAIEKLLADFASFNILKPFLGLVLLIGWTILIRATLRSLGLVSIILAVGFFGLLIWLLVDVSGLDASNLRIMSYIVELVLVGVLSAGVSWSHVRRKISGQVDMDVRG